MMNMEVNGTTIQVKLYENSSAEAVKELLKKGPFTIEMKDFFLFNEKPRKHRVLKSLKQEL